MIVVDDRTDPRIRVKPSTLLPGKWVWDVFAAQSTYSTGGDPGNWDFADSEERAWFAARVRLRTLDLARREGWL